MADPLVSVIIPAFNSSATIAEAVNSALTQTYDNLQIMVIDDGSTDHTPDQVRAFGDRVHLLQQERQGASAARNYGARSASGDYLAFLDADDIWEPAKITVQLAQIREGFGFVYTDRINFGDIGALSERQSAGVQLYSGDVFDHLLLDNFVTTSSVLLRRDLFLEMGGFNESLAVAHDWDLWLRIAEEHAVGLSKLQLVRYRVHSSGISKTRIEVMHNEQERILMSVLHSRRDDNGDWQSSTFAAAWRKSLASSAFAAANADQWRLAMKYYWRLVCYAPAVVTGYKGLLKCVLRRA